MDKKKISITIITVFVLLFISGTVFYFINKKETSQAVGGGVSSSPFGEALSSVIKDTFGLDTQKKDTETATTTLTTDITKNNPYSLKKIVSKYTTGAGFALVLEGVTKEELALVTTYATTSTSTTKKVRIDSYATTTKTTFATTTRIRYVETESGHIYEYSPASSTKTKLTNTLLPGSKEAYFIAGGSSVLLRYLGNDGYTIETFLGKIPTTSFTDTLSGTYLSPNILSVSVSPDTNDFFYLAKTRTGVIGNIYQSKTRTEKRVFSSEFSEWLPNFSTNGIFLTTKASSFVEGYTYFQPLSGTVFSRITGNKNGLTSLSSPDGSKLLYGIGPSLYILDVKTGSSLFVQGVRGLPEKCVWNTKSTGIYCSFIVSGNTTNLPDEWYKGKVSFEDQLGYIDPLTGSVDMFKTMRALSGDSSLSLDATNIQISQDESLLLFINKKDGSLWYFDIKAEEKIKSEEGHIDL
jgi:hypothetical protein